MPIEFVLCRRKDDHSLTHMIARRSLRRWPDWEPVPAPEPQRAETVRVTEHASVETAKQADRQPEKPPTDKPKT